MMASAGNAGAVSQAKEMIVNTIVGFVILLAAWLIVDTIMKTFVNQAVLVGPWNQIQCVAQPGYTAPPTATSTGGITATTTADCRYTLSTYSGIEENSPVQWANTDSALRSCAQSELGSVSSAYRTDAYQSHLYALWNTWCNLGLQNDTTVSCTPVRTSVSAEMNRHGLSCTRLVARSSSNHSAGIAVDIDGSGPQRNTACFTWFGPADRVHYTLRNACYGDCNPNN